MSHNELRASPPARELARHDQHPTKDTEPLPASTVARGVAPVVELADWRALRSWMAAAEHLNGRGLAAAVPASLIPALRRRGLVVWAAGERGAA